jgi:uncharacterized protein (TIGR03083 family)
MLPADMAIIAWEMVRAERIELADLLDTLTPEQWDAPSLCSGWRVRDVTAHLVEGATMTKAQMLGAAVRYGFRINTMLDREARRLGASPTDELEGALRVAAGNQNLAPGAKPVHVATDVLIHTQDIRRPLGLPRAIPEERLRLAADNLSTLPIGIPSKKRIAGLALRATDIDWSTGSGPEVSGPAEALIMVMGGRAAALPDLSGDGVATIASRVGA